MASLFDNSPEKEDGTSKTIAAKIQGDINQRQQDQTDLLRKGISGATTEKPPSAKYVEWFHAQAPTESKDSVHHRIGNNPWDAAAGNHTHKTLDLTDWPTGGLTGQMLISDGVDGINWATPDEPPEPLSQNFLINGGFDWWQRGTTSTTNGVYLADRWLINRSAGTHTVSRSTDVPNNTLQYSLSFASTSGTNPYINQRIESVNARPLVGQTVTFSVWAKSTVGTGSLVLQTLYPTTTADTFSASTVDYQVTLAASMTVGTWTRYSATFTVSANAVRGYSILLLRNVTTTSTTTLYAGAQLELGSAVSYFRRSAPTITLELLSCQRYYQRHVVIYGHSDGVWKVGSNPLGSIMRGANATVVAASINTPVNGVVLASNVTMTSSGQQTQGFYTSVGSAGAGAWIAFTDVTFTLEI